MVRTIAHNRVAHIVATAFMVLFLAAYAMSAAKADTRGVEAEAFIQDLAGSGLAMLEASEFTDTERELEFRRLTRRGFALDTIARFVAGRHWRTMTPRLHKSRCPTPRRG